jgi:hypothetical protein
MKSFVPNLPSQFPCSIPPPQAERFYHDGFDRKPAQQQDLQEHFECLSSRPNAVVNPESFRRPKSRVCIVL